VCACVCVCARVCANTTGIVHCACDKLGWPGQCTQALAELPKVFSNLRRIFVVLTDPSTGLAPLVLFLVGTGMCVGTNRSICTSEQLQMKGRE